ncbi:hypothetical protein C7M84_023755 [Penaeus vannamei]|uniref:Uncharacterized protein n=1 Tax=Penaeus vannamei TaxID=6689 RepID=A0A423U307_PENVA|nr:hypothetical protein C7M84_023755 [Penaeus vannamei]
MECKLQSAARQDVKGSFTTKKKLSSKDNEDAAADKEKRVSRYPLEKIEFRNKGNANVQVPFVHAHQGKRGKGTRGHGEVGVVAAFSRRERIYMKRNARKDIHNNRTASAMRSLILISAIALAASMPNDYEWSGPREGSSTRGAAGASRATVTQGTSSGIASVQGTISGTAAHQGTSSGTSFGRGTASGAAVSRGLSSGTTFGLGTTRQSSSTVGQNVGSTGYSGVQNFGSRIPSGSFSGQVTGLSGQSASFRDQAIGSESAGQTTPDFDLRGSTQNVGSAGLAVSTSGRAGTADSTGQPILSNGQVSGPAISSGSSSSQVIELTGQFASLDDQAIGSAGRSAFSGAKIPGAVSPASSTRGSSVASQPSGLYT